MRAVSLLIKNLQLRENKTWKIMAQQILKIALSSHLFNLKF